MNTSYQYHSILVVSFLKHFNNVPIFCSFDNYIIYLFFFVMYILHKTLILNSTFSGYSLYILHKYLQINDSEIKN